MPNQRKSLSGASFGRLTAIEVVRGGSAGKSVLWRCKCSCGKEVRRLSYDLIRGKRSGADQSCGCASEYDLTGKKYGELTAIRKVRRTTGLGVVWEFKCSCGTRVEKIGSSVKRGQGALHCGCKKLRGGNNRNDLTGKRFGMLLVVEFAGTSGRQQTQWKCRCDCGKVVTERGYNLRRGKTHCGCVSRTRSKNGHWKGVGELPKSYFTRTRRGAELRGFEFSVTIEDLWSLFLFQNRRCALTNDEIRFATHTEIRSGKEFTASLDRIDSTAGYVLSNVQWVHKAVNRMKLEMSMTEFISWCRKVVSHAS